MFAELRYPFERARCALASAEVAAETGTEPDAAERTAARDVFARVGAVPCVARCDALLRGGEGAAVAVMAQPRAADAPPDPAAVGSRAAVLSPAEFRVALAGADGATTAQLASTLFLSRKTVESHLGSIYCKLGVRNRSELVRMVVSQRRDTRSATGSGGPHRPVDRRPRCTCRACRARVGAVDRDEVASQVRRVRRGRC